MESIRTKLEQIIKDLYNIDFVPEITPSPENIATDYSTNAPLKLAKEIHKSPMQIAEEISQKMLCSSSSPGFLNFIVPDEFLNQKLEDLSNNFEEIISSHEYDDKIVICEFSDPNPFKIFHIGHFYTSIVGDSIGKLFESAGARVIRANFGGDVGLHVAKTIYALRQKGIKDLQIEDIAKCYVEGTAAYEDDPIAKAEITALNKEIYKINSENLHDSDLAKLYWKGRELSYAYFNDFYHSVGVKFDKYYPESTVTDLGITKVKEQLEKGVYEYSEGAVIFNGDKFGLHTRVFINREGVPTYETKDVGLIFTKWNDYHFDKSVVITGSEQLEYMKVVLKSIEQYAPDLVEKASHLIHGLVKLPGNVKMSSRKGNFLKATDVLEMVKNELKSTYNSSDPKISLAATKYAFLKYKMGGDIVFDPKESVKMTGNSGPYLLYSCVRAKKILQNSALVQAKGLTAALRNSHDPKESIKLKLQPSERNAIKKILEYETILEEAITEMAPHKIANYLYELAQDFSRFYENCSVNGSDQELNRLRLVKVYLDTMAHGLNILGIEIPEEM